jgi:hypothetical protein
MGIETLTRGAKRSYEQWTLDNPGLGIDQLFFPTDDIDTSAAFAMDRFTHQPHGVVFRNPNNQSQVRPFQAGTGYIYEVPIASEKTAIDETLKDQKALGLESTDPQRMHIIKIMNDIIRDHAIGHRMTKYYQAINVIRNGIYYALGPGGVDLGLSVNYTRAAGNSTTALFTGIGAIDMETALTNIYNILMAQGCPATNLIYIMGSSWLAEFASDATIQKWIVANQQNAMLYQTMIPPQLRNVPGLVVVAVYRAIGMLSPITICMYNPGVQYTAYNGAGAVDWIAATECIATSLDSPRYRVMRGVEAFTETGAILRQAGEVIFDTFHENDPITDFIRSQSRHIYIPANINHTVKSVGTF